MEKKLKVYRQGDVLLKEIRAIPENAKPVNDLVLALGEATGHSHRLSGKTVQVFQGSDGKKFVRAGTETVLVHDEHKHIPLMEGLYEVKLQREYSPQEIRRVQD